MRKIRIGKEIRIQWVLHAPAGIVLTSENLSLEIKDPKGEVVAMAEDALNIYDNSLFEQYVH